jgi:hypothetical protein
LAFEILCNALLSSGDVPIKTLPLSGSPLRCLLPHCPES